MITDHHAIIINNLKTLRQTAMISQKDLAVKLGMSRSSYSKLEQGLIQPDLETLTALSRFYKVTLDALVSADLQNILRTYFIHREYSCEESRLLKIYNRLSRISKGQLIQQAEELLRLDTRRRQEKLRAKY